MFIFSNLKVDEINSIGVLDLKFLDGISCLVFSPMIESRKQYFVPSHRLRISKNGFLVRTQERLFCLGTANTR